MLICFDCYNPNFFALNTCVLLESIFHLDQKDTENTVNPSVLTINPLDALKCTCENIEYLKTLPEMACRKLLLS